jgi:hypothetical protein
VGFNTRLSLNYDQGEVGSLDEDLLRLCRWSGSDWTCYPRSAQSDSAANVACADNVTAFSDWTLGTVGPTAVTVRDLQAADRVARYAPIGLALIAMIVLGALVFVNHRRAIIKR